MTTAILPNSREAHADRAAYHTEQAADEANTSTTAAYWAAWHTEQAAYHTAEMLTAAPTQTAR